MFTNKNESMVKNDFSPAINMIGSGTIITGDIQSKGDIRVDGTLKGSINTEGKVVLGANGTIEGDVICQDADISGTINAKITVSKLLSLKATARLNGDIVTSKLSIEPGATFTGSCSMGAVIKDIKNVEKPEKKERAALEICNVFLDCAANGGNNFYRNMAWSKNRWCFWKQSVFHYIFFLNICFYFTLLHVCKNKK